MYNSEMMDLENNYGVDIKILSDVVKFYFFSTNGSLTS